LFRSCNPDTGMSKIVDMKSVSMVSARVTSLRAVSRIAAVRDAEGPDAGGGSIGMVIPTDDNRLDAVRVAGCKTGIGIWHVFERDLRGNERIEPGAEFRQKIADLFQLIAKGVAAHDGDFTFDEMHRINDPGGHADPDKRDTTRPGNIAKHSADHMLTSGGFDHVTETHIG